MIGKSVSTIIKAIEANEVNMDEVKHLLIDGDDEQKVELALYIGRRRISSLLNPLMEAFDIELKPEIRSVYFWAISLIAPPEATEQLVKWLIEETDQECKASMQESFIVFAEIHNIDYSSIKVLSKEQHHAQTKKKGRLQDQMLSKKPEFASLKTTDNSVIGVWNILNQFRPNIPVSLMRIAQLSGVTLERLEELLTTLETTGELPGEYLRLEQVFIRNPKKLFYTRCKTCGEPTKSYPCEFCGKGEVCSTCRLVIGMDDDVIACPYCGAGNHKKHLQEWVKIKGNCPSCKAKLSMKQIS